MSTAGPISSSSASSPPPVTTSHVTKDNIQQLTYYEIFRLDRTAAQIDVAALRRAYRRFSLLFHPDKDNTPAAREAFERVTRAADTLADATKRQAYDAELRAQQQQQQQQDEAGAHGEGSAMVDNASARRAAEEARLAEDALRQREQTRAAQSAEAARLAQQREAATANMLNELTHALHTPFKQTEQALVQEWDVDEDLLAMKLAEVEQLLGELESCAAATAVREDEDEDGGAPGLGHKRARAHDER